jgi:hypothetical protein
LLLGELCSNLDACKAVLHYQKAYELAKTPGEKHSILGKIERLNNVEAGRGPLGSLADINYQSNNFNTASSP